MRKGGESEAKAVGQSGSKVEARLRPGHRRMMDVSLKSMTEPPEDSMELRSVSTDMADSCG